MRTGQVLLLISALTPLAAEAHGEQVLAVPVGNVVAVVALVVACMAHTLSRLVTAVSVGLAVVVSAAVWFIPMGYLPQSLRWTFFGNFVLGFLPAVLAGATVLAISVAARR